MAIQAIPLTIVSGGHYTDRETAIAQVVQASMHDLRCAVILEGLPSGDPILHAQPNLLIHRIAPGCFCCIGNLTLRVTVQRCLRSHLDHLYLAVASSEHLERLRQMLAEAPFNSFLLAPSIISL